MLLQTKLFVPPRRRSLIPRPQLVAKLNAGLNHRLTLISAPAGFGKTTLVADWLSAVEWRAVWVSLDEDDNDLVQFFTYAAAAVQQVEGVDKEIQRLLRAPQPASPKSLATALINDCAAALTPFVLVFDDYHVIVDNVIHESVAFLLDHPPLQLHLVIISRTDPLLPLPRLRARGHMTELRTEDLRFRAAEAAAFLQQHMGLNLTAKQVAALETRTEGWIAGLQLAALSIQGMTEEAEITAFLADFTGSHRYIFDYLTDEVLAQRPPETKSFLLETAVLDRFNADLCTAVTGNPASQSILHTLESANLFLFPLDDKRQWYRYHPLFADLLRHRLSQRPKRERDRLHRQAARWFEANGMVDPAVRHYKEAADQESVVRLIKQQGSETLQPGQLSRLQRWLDVLSPDQIQSDAWLAFLRAWICYFEQKTEQGSIWVEHAQQQLEVTGDLPDGGANQLRGSVIGLQSWLASQQGDFKRAIRLAGQALDIMPESESIWRGKVYVFLAEGLAGEGRTTEAIAAYEKSLEKDSQASNWITVSAITAGIWMKYVLRGRLNEAKVQLDRIIARVTSLEQPLTASSPRMARLAILYEQNDLAATGSELSDLRTIAQYDQGIATARYQLFSALYSTAVNDRENALTTLLQMEEGISSWTTPDEKARAMARLMRIYLRLERPQKPLAWLQAVSMDQDNLTLLRIDEYLATADILRFSDSFEARQDGLELMEAVHKLCDDAETYGIKIEVYCLQALLMEATHNAKGALDAIRHALTLAESEKYVRTFVDFGQPMASLLHQAVTRHVHPQYARFLLTQFSRNKLEPERDGAKRQRTVEPLSVRELEVLSLLTTYLTGPEIASRLQISINTYKTHTRNIYSKLGVSSRAAAVVQAQELGLLGL